MIRGAMSNGGTSFIKKQIFLSLGLFFSCSNIGAMSCPQTVGPILASDGIWTVLSRVGLATNVIESQICAIAPSNAGISDLSCTFTFGQTDIGGGNIYNIVSPGTYCMAQNITFTAGTAIRVNSSDVTIEMKGHTLSGGGNPNTLGIALGAGVQNVTIQNGIIEHLAGSSPTGGIGIIDQVISAGQTLKNITIQNMSFNNNSSSAIRINASSSSTIYAVDGLMIENCDMYNSGAITVQGYSATVQGCSSYANNGVTSNIFLTGPSSAPAANNFQIQDCIVTSSFSNGLGTIFMQQVENGVISNCISQGSTGFNVAHFTTMVISDCVVQTSGQGSHGFSITNPFVNATLTMERCVAEKSATDGFHIETNTGGSFAGLTLVDCIAQFNAGNGFLLQNETLDWGNIIVTGCRSTGNGLNGFVVVTAAAVRFFNMVFESCVAQANSGDGFSVISAPTGALIRDVVFRNCVSQSNLGNIANGYFGDGFAIGTATANASSIFGVTCQNCTAQENVHNGFSFASTVTLCKVLDNCSMFNTGTGFANLGGTSNAFIANVSLFNTAADYTGLASSDSIQSRADGLNRITAFDNVSS